jgi:4-aminobutyrate--pyruvate transaminase
MNSSAKCAASAVELVADKATHTNFDPKQKVGPRAAKLMEAHGVVGRAMTNDLLGFCPPLIVTEREIDEIIDGTEKALNDLALQLRREKLTVVA